MSAYAARAQQKLQQAVRTNSSAFESYSTLCLWLLHCCVAIQSHPRGLPYIFFLLLYVAVFAYTTHTLCIAVSSVHVTIICTQIRQIGNIRNFEISCIISYQYLWIVYIHKCTWVRARVKRTFLFLWDLPSFCQFCRLALSGFYRLTRPSGNLVVIFS